MSPSACTQRPIRGTQWHSVDGCRLERRPEHLPQGAPRQRDRVIASVPDLMREAISLMREALKQSSEAIGGNRRGPQRAPHGGHVTRGCELGVARLGLEEERLAAVLAVS